MYVVTVCKYEDHSSIIDEDTGLKRKSLHPQGNFPLLFFSVFQKGFAEEMTEEMTDEMTDESPEKSFNMLNSLLIRPSNLKLLCNKSLHTFCMFFLIFYLKCKIGFS